MTVQRTTIFMEFEVITPKMNDTEKKEFIHEVNNCRINPSTETHNETAEEQFSEIPSGWKT